MINKRIQYFIFMLFRQNGSGNFKLLPVLFLSVFILYSFYLLPVQNKKQTDLLSKAHDFNTLFPLEKLYLHLDRPSYWAGGDIWFKAYLINGVTQECNLYVELINSSGNVISKNRCWSQNGLAYGDFHLADTLSSGIYQVRAYTDWMRNFDNAYFFRKNVVIWGLRNKTVDENSKELKSKDVDLQFFPESGTFVTNIQNRVAFKAIDKNGKGIGVKGTIEDNLGNRIVDFESLRNGMGSVVFTPLPNRKYVANATSGDITLEEVELPVGVSEGIQLSLKNNDAKKIAFQITASNNKSDFLIVGQSDGKLCYRNEIKWVEKTSGIEIDKDSLPTGVVRFTLFDEHAIPQCERLVFINHHDFIQVQVNPDKYAYRTREKVNLDLKTITNQGFPCLSNLSLSVYNPENQIEIEEYPSNILTHILLSSELKGNIENPAWYFKDDSLSTLIALDNLLLTHGYRSFEWEKIAQNRFPEIVYPPEKSILVKGNVTKWFSDKPAEGVTVTLMSLKSLLEVHQETTDSLGNFVFSNLFFNDNIHISLQAGDLKERRKYWIDLDEKSNVSPKVEYLPFNYKYQNEKAVNTTFFLNETNSDLINRKWHLTDTILLGDVNILAKEKEEETIHLRPYLDADFIFEVEKHDDIYADIMEMLESASPFMRMFIENRGPQFFLDGVLVERDFIYGLPSSWFEKVEAVRLAPGRNGFGPGLFFFSKRGETQTIIRDGLGIKGSKITGYSVIRKFYSPDYETEQPLESTSDFRNTIYWNPIVRTDSTGIARASFYTSDEPGNLQIVVEGITTDGKICRGLGVFSVQEESNSIQ